jgi:hypothetical protein
LSRYFIKSKETRLKKGFKSRTKRWVDGLSGIGPSSKHEVLSSNSSTINKNAEPNQGSDKHKNSVIVFFVLGVFTFYFGNTGV